MEGGSPRPRGQWYRSILKGWMRCSVVGARLARVVAVGLRGRWTAVGWWFHSVSSAMARLAAHAGGPGSPGDKRVPIFPATFCPCTYIDSSYHNATTPSPFLAWPIPSPRAAHSISAGWLRLPTELCFRPPLFSLPSSRPVTPQQPPTMQEKKDGETRQLRRERRGEPVNGTDSSGLSRADVQSKLVARTRSNIEGGAEGRARRRCDSDGGRDWTLDTLEPLFPPSLGISDRTGRPGRPPPPRQRGRGPILACV